MASEKRLIDVSKPIRETESIINFREQHHMPTEDYISFLNYLKKQPTVDAVEVVHGRWVSRMHKNTLGDYFRFHCSECGEDKPNSIHINFCPNCGAKMDGGNEDV